MPVPEGTTTNDTKAETNNLRAADFPVDTRWTLKIADVNLELMPARDNKPPRKRLVLSFEGKTKRLVLNATNQGFLEARLGNRPNTWPGAAIVLHRSTTMYGKDIVAAFLITECYRGDTPQAREASDF